MPRKERGSGIYGAELRVGTAASYIKIDRAAKISQYGTQTASLVNLSVATGACAGGATNYSQIDSGVISQAGTACATLLETSIGGGTTITAIYCGSLTASMGAVAPGASDAQEITCTGLAVDDKVFVTATSGLESDVAIQSVQGADTNKLSIRIYNHHGATTFAVDEFDIYFLALRDMA